MSAKKQGSSKKPLAQLWADAIQALDNNAGHDEVYPPAMRYYRRAYHNHPDRAYAAAILFALGERPRQRARQRLMLMDERSQQTELLIQIEVETLWAERGRPCARCHHRTTTSEDAHCTTCNKVLADLFD